ncbi:uncharacterized protein BP5553_05830 [Venustampulla echinocandica]|uniref:Uncharacterized protein n=1 Tax=Venustampulla echinocandica TaxID=2656787 RepID=A0A370TLT1_9HELO|nr:uncharacterized protein BP5553_05830 [Venustampulla echinocandica]RDL36478.1 hypothetical protein BP5553_05830 [Venustampulla echinocandica]
MEVAVMDRRVRLCGRTRNRAWAVGRYVERALVDPVGFAGAVQEIVQYAMRQARREAYLGLGHPIETNLSPYPDNISGNRFAALEGRRLVVENNCQLAAVH